MYVIEHCKRFYNNEISVKPVYCIVFIHVHVVYNWRRNGPWDMEQVKYIEFCQDLQLGAQSYILLCFYILTTARKCGLNSVTQGSMNF
jgi:hypothetical protein